MKKILTIVLCALCFVSPKAQAETAVTETQLQALSSQVSQLSRVVQDLKIIVETQNSEIRSLKGQRTHAMHPEHGADEPPASEALHRTMPEIGVVADMAVRLDSPKLDTDGADRLQLRELELILGGALDPQTRLDSTTAITEDDGTELEEAYMTRYGLPTDITLRAGRMRPRIGKVIPLHHDSLDTVDQPLVIRRYFGAEGFSKTGADVTKAIKLPWAVEHELTAGVLEGGNGEEGTLFGDTRRRPTLYSHLKNSMDLSDATSLEIGLSHLTGSRDGDSEFEVHVLGIDGTLNHQWNEIQNIKLQGEVFNVNRTESDLDGNIYGGYALADLRFHPRWSSGFRWDGVQIVDRPVDSPNEADIGYSAYLTFHQSAFVRFRFQFSHFDLTDGSDDNQVMLQGTFTVGEH